MSVVPRWLVAASLAFSLLDGTVSACHKCKQSPCIIAPPAEPAFECVTEMVPFTVMKSKTRVDLVPVCTKTVMETKIDIEYDEQMRTVCKPVFDTIWETRCSVICRPVCETTMVCQPYKVCRPVTRTRQVTEYCWKPYTEQIVVPVKTGCRRCGHSGGGCTCQTVARTCYKKVPVVREVSETCMVTEVVNQMVPVVHTRMVAEQRVDRVPVTVCRMVNQVVRVKVPRMVCRSVPKTLVYKTAVLSCEEVPVTVYRPVTRMVPVVLACPQAIASPQGVTAGPSGQAEVISPIVPPERKPLDAEGIPRDRESTSKPSTPAPPPPRT
jgi:hypothetical protein